MFILYFTYRTVCIPRRYSVCDCVSHSVFQSVVVLHGGHHWLVPFPIDLINDVLVMLKKYFWLKMPAVETLSILMFSQNSNQTLNCRLSANIYNIIAVRSRVWFGFLIIIYINELNYICLLVIYIHTCKNV